ncbi:MAG: replication initiator protein [Microviridae sp.]|nr:MAG: replication initiator protein [Microviridae sp.]
MPCYRPLTAYRTSTGVVFSELSRYDVLGTIELPCGQCIGCRMRRASDWELRVMHEASMWEQNCFVTLTYGRDCLPENGSLDYRDFQLFMKRLRDSFRGRRIRFYMCGEYGEAGGRPHYHACLFNVDFDDKVPAGKSKGGEVYYDSKRLSRLWGHGIVSVQPLVRETAGYCARYIMKKALGEAAKTAHEFTTADGEILQRKSEFAVMSLRPGIGAGWFERFAGDVFPLDSVVADGVKRPVPKYYDRLAKRKKFDRDALEFAREQRAKAHAADNTVERRAVREKVHLAKVRDLKRDSV